MTDTTTTPGGPSQAAADAKALAEAKAADALAVKHEAEARKANLEADSLAAQYEANLIALGDVRRSEQARLAGDYEHRTFRFTEPVTSVTAKACMARLSEWQRIDDGETKRPIEIIFNSPGGSVVDGMALFDFIQDVRGAGHHVTTSCLGMAASMAGILLQAGDTRTMGKQSWLMIHEASFGAQGKIGEVEDTVEWVKMVQKRILRIFADRSKLTAAQIDRKWKRTDWWLSADHALELGFIDAIRGQEAAAA